MLGASRVEALTDALTGLGNRRALTNDLASVLDPDDAEAAAPSVLALFDLDGFKHYNDSFGHPSGDALLAAPRRAPRARRRRPRRAPTGWAATSSACCSTPPTTCPSRPARSRCTSPARASPSAARTARCCCPPRPTTPSEALRIADQRLYEHKRGGRPDDAARDQGGDAADPRRARPGAEPPRRPTSPSSPSGSRQRSACIRRRSSTCASPPSCTTSARSRSPTRSCSSPARSTPASGASWSATR